MTGTGRAGLQPLMSRMPATGAAAAIRSAYLHATADVMNAPFESPVTKTRFWSTQSVLLDLVEQVADELHVGRAEVGVPARESGPVPWGVIVMKSCVSPNGPRLDIISCDDRALRSSRGGPARPGVGVLGRTRRDVAEVPALLAARGRRDLRLAARHTGRAARHPADGFAARPSPPWSAVVGASAVFDDEAPPLRARGEQPATATQVSDDEARVRMGASWHECPAGSTSRRRSLR